uniref:Uncharacterized protein n=1 Tax=Oryza sativa subsp. japonica TaxID=39947 RepID=Q6EQM7_ORYSJ|nr:hypothetical protein [Oryza sativa Japonica Group]BAD29043.1 hypothetical protein [Oryza sativa Japonica Group]
MQELPAPVIDLPAREHPEASSSGNKPAKRDERRSSNRREGSASGIDDLEKVVECADAAVEPYLRQRRDHAVADRLAPDPPLGEEDEAIHAVDELPRPGAAVGVTGAHQPLGWAPPIKAQVKAPLSRWAQGEGDPSNKGWFPLREMALGGWWTNNEMGSQGAIGVAGMEAGSGRGW